MRPRPDLPGPGQESVWAYPRPPRIDPTDEHVEVWFADQRIASTRRAVRVLETSHAPTYYLPLEDVAAVLRASPARTFCEFKGVAHYFDVVVGDDEADQAAWTYPEPAEGYEALAGMVAFYPGRMQRCLVAGEQVTPQGGGFYGGWITSRVVGPFKGGVGTHGW